MTIFLKVRSQEEFPKERIGNRSKLLQGQNKNFRCLGSWEGIDEVSSKSEYFRPALNVTVNTFTEGILNFSSLFSLFSLLFAKFFWSFYLRLFIFVIYILKFFSIRLLIALPHSKCTYEKNSLLFFQYLNILIRLQHDKRDLYYHAHSW